MSPVVRPYIRRDAVQAVVANVKRTRAELEEIRLRPRAVSERLIGTDPNCCADGCGRYTSSAVAGSAVGC